MTTLEREILVALLERTHGESLSRDNLRESFRVTNDAFESFIDMLVSEELIMEDDGDFSASPSQRLEMAVRAIREGADFERVSRTLGWLEFEEMVAYTFEENGYRVKRRFRFNAEGRRWEIDVLATKKPLVVCAECKHWSKGLGNLTARKIVETHLEKVRVLSMNVTRLAKRLNLRGWEKAIFVPMALSLQPARNKIYRRIPVVSVFELPSFLSEFEGQMGWLANFSVELPPPKPRFSQTVLSR